MARVSRGAAGDGLRSMKERRYRDSRERALDRTFGWVTLAVVIVFGLTAALGGGPMLSLIGGLGVVTMVAITLARLAANREALVAAAGFAATIVLLAVVVGGLRKVVGDPAPVPLGSVFWALVAAAAPFLAKFPRADRGVTALMCEVGVLFGEGVSSLLQALGFLFTVGWIVGVVAWRNGGVQWVRTVLARMRSGAATSYGTRRGVTHPEDRPVVFSDANLDRGAAAETATGRLLSALPAGWHVLHSRVIPGARADLDHLVIGTPGVFLVDSKDWGGRIENVEVGGGFALALNGDVEQMMRKLDPIVFEAREVQNRMSLLPGDVAIILCFTSRMRLPEPVLRLDVDGWPVTLLHSNELLRELEAQPARQWRYARRLDRVRHRGVDVAELDARRNSQFVADLAVVADYSFPPA